MLHREEASMSERATQLQVTVDEQIASLLDIVSTLDDAALRRPCRGRQKLGDGTVAALALHTADNYQRIGTFVQTSDRPSAGDAAPQRVPRLLRRLGHRPPGHADHDRRDHGGADRYTADSIDRSEIVDQLCAVRERLGQIATLTDDQLDAIPLKDSFRFCDGQRTLAQVLASLLKHQSHQVETLTATAS
jgi:hypothetical protein